MKKRPSKQPMEFTSASMLPGPGVVAKERLETGRRFVLIQFGSSPSVMAIDEPGTYEIDAAAIAPDARWPVALLTIPAEHAAMFERMTVAYSDAWLTAMVEQMRRQADA